jgi:hypothetical protein
MPGGRRRRCLFSFEAAFAATCRDDLSRRTLLGSLLNHYFLAFLIACEVQMIADSPLPSVPITKILAIGSLKAPLTSEQRQSIMSREVPATVRLYLAGKIDQWYARHDGKGVVFLLNLSSIEEAHSMLEALPLGQAQLMTFELIPIGPLSPLGLLVH